MLHFRVTEDTMKKLKEMARKEGLSVSAVARTCLERFLGKDKRA